MKICVGSGVGVGPTKLAAFDAALNSVGVANYNLIRLSSVIPPQSEIIVHKGQICNFSSGGWGDRLYVVIAEKRVQEIGAAAWAGIGWVQDANTGKGLFVEHEGDSEPQVRDNIEASLNALMKTRSVNFGPIQMQVVGDSCKGEPLCAIVIAVYQASAWRTDNTLLQE